jgi:hypothetical protein
MKEKDKELKSFSFLNLQINDVSFSKEINEKHFDAVNID